MKISGPKEVQIILRQPGKIVVRYDSMDAAHRWKAFLLAMLVVSVLFWVVAGWVLGTLLIVPAAYTLAASCFSWTIVTVQGGGISWKHGPLPAKSGRETKFEELHSIVVGRMKSKKQIVDLFSAGVRRKNGKIWCILQNMPSIEAASQTAGLISEAMGGLNVEEATMPGPTTLDRWMCWLLVLLTIALVGWFSWMSIQ